MGRSEIRRQKDGPGFTDDDIRRLRTYRDDLADSAEQMADDVCNLLTN
jgi:hypothetical protein